MSAQLARLRPADPRYDRPLLPWVRRRARRLQRVYGLARNLAVAEAATHYGDFTGSRLAKAQAKRRAARLLDVALAEAEVS